MIPLSELVVLDSSVLVHLIRGDRIGQRIESDHQLLGRRDRPLISIVTIGELRALALKLSWGQSKRRRLNELLGELVVVNLNQGDVIDRYAEIDHYSEQTVKPARRMAKNDIWIAATAAASGAHLLTTDSDFDHLNPQIISVARVDQRTGAQIL